MMWQKFLKNKKKEGNLLFRQSVQKGQKEIVLVLLIFSVIAFLLSTMAWIFEGMRMDQLWGIFLLPTVALGMPVIYVLYHFEKFEIYEDKIIVRNTLRIMNRVLLENVKFVEEGKLLLARASAVDYYILNDGRKNKRPGRHHQNDFQNRKKYNFRIYKTDELEIFLKERFEIRQKDFFYED